MGAGSFIARLFCIQVDADYDAVIIRLYIYVQTRIKSTRIETSRITYLEIFVRILDFNVAALAEEILRSYRQFWDYETHDTIIVEFSS